MNVCDTQIATVDLMFMLRKNIDEFNVLILLFELSEKMYGIVR